MHRDHKLGLALGVLVIGFAGALCFPKQPAGSDLSLELKDAAQLDADIELLPVRAYTEAESRPAVPEAARVPSQTKPDETSPAPVWKGEAEGVDLFAGPPEPIRPPASAVPMPVNPSLVETRQAPTPTPTVEISRQPPSDKPADAAAQLQHYTVRPGDTLSGLASRFLGSSLRYREIFEANREVLATPDDIRVGMVLTIPEREFPRPAVPDAALLISDEPVRLVEALEPLRELAPPSRETHPTEPGRSVDPGSDRMESAAGGGDPKSRLFRPFGRSPFIPGPVGRPGT